MMSEGLHYRRKNKLVEYDISLFGHVAISFALHALQFEKYGKNRDEYVTLSLEDYKKAVLRFPLFVEEIEKHPFEKEKYIQQYAEKIQKASAFDMYYSSFYEQYIFFENAFWWMSILTMLFVTMFGKKSPKNMLVQLMKTEMT